MSAKVQYIIQAALVVGGLITAFIFVSVVDVEENARSRILILGVTIGSVVAILFNFVACRKRKKVNSEKKTHR